MRMCAAFACSSSDSGLSAFPAEQPYTAEANRRWLGERRIAAVHLFGSPGAGKTTLLERTLRAMGEVAISAIEGDPETERDASRIRAAGAQAMQLNTGSGCHLDAQGVGCAMESLAPAPGSLLFIEDVGNLVCPPQFDLGESAKVVVLSTPEGDDKPLKYPHIFRAAQALVISKIDLLPYVPFDAERCAAWALQLNPSLRVFRISAITGQGLDAWCGWLGEKLAAARAMMSLAMGSGLAEARP